MELCKWASNNPRVIIDNGDTKAVPIQTDKDPKTLGLVWNPASDTLNYEISYTNNATITKRMIASTIARIFDPLGLVGSVIIEAKIIFQELWKANTNWYESIPQALHMRWQEIYTSLAKINDMIIPRQAIEPRSTRIEYHGFCDASESAYGAYIYACSASIYACLNSRPLSPLSNDPNDLTPLTPGHFLIGDSLTALPEEDLRDVKSNRPNRFQHLQKMMQHFCYCWHKECLLQYNQAHRKYKNTSHPVIKPGTMVLVKEDNVPPLRWPLGRILEVHPGKDGVTRVVSVRVANGTVKRPVSKICVLPIEDNNEAQS